MRLLLISMLALAACRTDNDCDGDIDEDVRTEWYADADEAPGAAPRRTAST